MYQNKPVMNTFRINGNKIINFGRQSQIDFNVWVIHGQKALQVMNGDTGSES